MSFKAFWSRLTLVGNFTLESPLRIGGEGDSLAVDSTGQPILPGSSFRGALRAYIESVLRGIEGEEQVTHRTIMLRGADGLPAPSSRLVQRACDSTDKRDDDLNYQGCLTRVIVARWEKDPILGPKLDEALVECSCSVCRLFGAPWIAGRVQVADLRIVDTWDGSLAQRGGLSLSRDRDVMIEGSSYQRSAVPAGTQFSVQITVENATPAEQGLLLVGLRAFEAGLVPLGADRARGFGYGRLTFDWPNCREIDSEHLISVLLGAEAQPFSDADAEARINAFAASLRTP